MRHLLVFAGPIGAGKSTVATLLAGKARATGLTCSLADLDDIAFSQRADLSLEEYWRRAGVAHSALVRGWFEAGVDVVVAHGPFFESNSYESLRAAAPGDARHHHVLLRVTFEAALSRVQADPGRGPGARSTQPEFLRATHQVFAETVDSLPGVDVEMDTTGRTAAEVADQVFDLLDLQ